MRRSWFALVAGRRAKWVVFVALVPGDLHRRRAREPSRQVRRRRESTRRPPTCPGRRIDQGAGRHRGTAERRTRPRGDRLPARVGPDAGRPPEDRSRRRRADREALRRGDRGRRNRRLGRQTGRRGHRRRGAGPAGCGGPTTPSPASPPATRRSSARSARRTARRRSSPPTSRPKARATRIVDPVEDWRDAISDQGGGLEVKITGGAGFSADAIEVFEGINGTLLLAALALVIFLLIVIYRSPIFLFIPLIAVVFAEILSRSIGYGVSELGVTINGQSSSIMSVLVLGAGTDYALLLVARYREELHHTTDKHEAMRTALRSAGPAILASARDRDRGAALPDDRQGQRHLGPRPDRRDRHRLRGALDADPAAGAADDLRPPRLLALRPAHAETAPAEAPISERARRAIVEGSAVGALGRRRPRLPRGAGPAAARADQLAAARAQRRADPVADRRPARPRASSRPYELRRYRHEHASDATHGFWARVGERIARSPAAGDRSARSACC